MQLTKIQKITGQIELLSGLHIGSGNTEIHIGGTDNPVIKNPINRVNVTAPAAGTGLTLLLFKVRFIANPILI